MKLVGRGAGLMPDDGLNDLFLGKSFFVLGSLFQSVTGKRVEVTLGGQGLQII